MANRSFNRSGTFRRGGSRRLTDWGVQLATTGRIAIPANSKVLVAAVTAAVLEEQAPATIVRTRGYLSVLTDNVTASETQIGAFGCALFNSVSLNAGIASLPSPGTDGTFDGWFVWSAFGQATQVNSAIGFNTLAAERIEVDSKAMRKFDRDLGLAFIVDNQHATNAFNVMFNFRLLIKAG